MSRMTLLPPAPDKCQACAVSHAPEDPHDATSLYFQYFIYGKKGRWGTWEDAIEHMADDAKEAVRRVLRDMSIDPASPLTRGGAS